MTVYAQHAGSLAVRVECDSAFLGSTMPIEVRDAGRRLVASGAGSWSGELPPGLYAVDAMTPDGSVLKELVHVRAGEVSAVVLTGHDGWTVAGTGVPEPSGAEAVPEPAGAGEAAGGGVGEPGPDTGTEDAFRTRTVPPASRLPPMVAPSPASGAARSAPRRQAAPPPTPPPTAGAEPPAPAGEVPATAGAPSADAVQLEEALHCEGTPDADGWVFLPLGMPPEVPTARFRVGAEEWLLSLPLNPTSQDPQLASCRVSVVQDGRGPRLAVSFAPMRRVTSFVDGMRRSRSLEKAGPMLAEATDLLLWKYEEPAGATLGGLALHRLGALQGRRDWVENLAHGFGWIPDTGVLLAAVLVGDEREHRRGLDALLTAAAHRPMFTDGLSLALDLLRGWPAELDADDSARRRAALERLADLSAWADWDSVSLTTVTGGAR